MTHRLIATLAVLSALCSFSTQAQDLKVTGTNNHVILHAENMSTVLADRVAVYGKSTPGPFYGVGADFQAGYIAVRARTQYFGAGHRYGGMFTATGGDGGNYGVYSMASASGSGSAWAGYFAGNVYVSGSFTQASDARLKYNVALLPEGSLNKLLRLKPRSYRYISSSSLNLPTGDQVGFVAQEIQEIFPDLVQETLVPSTDKSKKEETILSVDYIKLIPILVKAIQEQQAQIEELEAQLARLVK